jgi:hypothetical protein
MEIWFVLIIALITILSLILLTLTLLSYRKYKNKKLFFVSLVFLVLFIRGLLLSISIFNEEIIEITSNSYIWIFDLIILVLLYAAYSLKG